MDFDSFVISINTRDFLKDLQNFEDLFDFSNLSENHELLSNRNKKVRRKFKVETPKIIWIDEFICLKSKIFVLNVKMIVKTNGKLFPNLN